MQPLSDYLHERRARVEQHLDAALHAEAGLPASLLAAMRYSLLAPGKRLRPLLVVTAWGNSGTVAWSLLLVTLCVAGIASRLPQRRSVPWRRRWIS